MEIEIEIEKRGETRKCEEGVGWQRGKGGGGG